MVTPRVTEPATPCSEPHAFPQCSHRIVVGIALAPGVSLVKVCMSYSASINAVAVVGTALLLAVPLVSESRQDPATASAPKIVEVTARKFEFEPSRIEVTQGDHVRLVVRSQDGVHGVSIKKFKVNKSVPRGGDAITIDFVAAAAGTFEILCSEFCGDGHEEMSGTLVVRAKPR